MTICMNVVLIFCGPERQILLKFAKTIYLNFFQICGVDKSGLGPSVKFRIQAATFHTREHFRHENDANRIGG